MLFGVDAPGALTEEGGSYYGDWSLETVEVISEAAAEAWISDALTDPQGWGRADITFRQHASGSADARVQFYVVDELIGRPTGWAGAASNNGDGTGQVSIEAAYHDDPTYGLYELVNHEAAHAFFGAEHSDEGIMPHSGSAASTWPSDANIASLRAWLGLPPDPEAGDPTPTEDLWFPGNLEYYITRWPVEPDMQARLSTTVIEGAHATLRAVCAEEYADLLAGTHERFTRSVGVSEQGMWTTGWRDAPDGGLYRDTRPGRGGRCFSRPRYRSG